MYLSLLDVNKFPRLDAILKDIPILVRNNNTIFKEIDDYTGNHTDILTSALTYGLPPRVNPYMHSEIYEKRGTIIKTEGGITTSTPTRTSTSTLHDAILNVVFIDIYKLEMHNIKFQTYLYGSAFMIMFSILHELMHALRWYNAVGPMYNKGKHTPKKYIPQEEDAVYRGLERAFDFTSTDYHYYFEDTKNVSELSNKYIPYFKSLKKLLEDQSSKQKHYRHY